MSTKAAVLAVCVIALETFSPPKPRLVWNASASAPIGLYFVSHHPASTGDLVLAKTPDSVHQLAEERRYVPSTVPLVKRIAAASGDQICADKDTVFINGRPVATRLKTDSERRPLPIWTGCHVLDHEVFLLMADVPSSFDGRYFGPVPNASVVGRLHPLWIHTH